MSVCLSVQLKNNNWNEVPTYIHLFVTCISCIAVEAKAEWSHKKSWFLGKSISYQNYSWGIWLTTYLLCFFYFHILTSTTAELKCKENIIYLLQKILEIKLVSSNLWTSMKSLNVFLWENLQVDLRVKLLTKNKK